MKDRIGEHERPEAPEVQQEEPAAPLRELASNLGNRVFTDTIARQG